MNPALVRIKGMQMDHRKKPVVVKTELEHVEAPKICIKKDQRKCFTFLRKGEPSPFTGALQTKELGAAQVAKYEKLLELSLDAVDTERGYATVRELQADKDEKADLEAKDAHIKLLEQAVEDASPSWYESPAFVIPLTAALTLGACALAIKGAQELRE